jgi:CBS domain containing-hemolysin-like protein
VAPLIWVFGEIVPKSIFQQRADVITPKVIFILKGASVLFFPLLIIFTTMTRILTRIVRGKQEKSLFTLREEIDLMRQMDSGSGDIHAMEKDMIRRTFAYGKTRAREIMIPYVDVSSVKNTAVCREALDIAGKDGGHPMIPVYSGRVDKVVGQIHTMDLLGEPNDTPIRSFIKPVRFVYGSKRLEKLLEAFRTDGDRIAIVVDEFGSAEGLVSMKDIIERIVGDMESHQEAPLGGTRTQKDVSKVQDGVYQVNPRIDLVALNQATGVQLPNTGHYETLSGFLLEQFGDIPTKGAVCEHEGTTFEVEQCSNKRIQSVKITLPASG